MFLFIFDFDNTLGDAYGPYGEGNIFRTKTLPDVAKATEIYEKYRRGTDDIVVYPKLLEEYGISDPDGFFREVGIGKQLFPDVIPFLTKLKNNPIFTTVILTTGDEEFQKLKTTLTGVDILVDEIYITRERNKINHIKNLVAKYQPSHTIFVDDKIYMTEDDFVFPITIYQMDRAFQKNGPQTIHSLNQLDLIHFAGADQMKLITKKKEMKKIIGLNWKKTQTPESARDLGEIIATHSDLSTYFEMVLFPGCDIMTSVSDFHIPLGSQDFSEEDDLPYVLVGHMSRRINGESNETIRKKLIQISTTHTLPILCIGSRLSTDTLPDIIQDQLSVMDIWPREKPLVISYEPSHAIGTGSTLSIDDISIVTECIRAYTSNYFSIRILYGGSVSHSNIMEILSVTDGVLVGTASQSKKGLTHLYGSLLSHVIT